MAKRGDNGRERWRFRADLYVFAALSLVSFSVLLFSARSFVADFKNMGLSMYTGLRGSIHELTSFVSRTVDSVQELSTLRQEYAGLTERMTRYEQLERNAAEIRQENERLREQLGFSQSLMYRHIAAEITGRDPDNLFQAFVINKGSRHGIAANMPVIAYQNGSQTLVGKVIQTAGFESLVMPLYDTGSYISSRLFQARFEGIVEGQGNPDAPLLMRFIRGRTRDEINIGDLVVSSGLGGVYPPGISIGRVSRIYHQDNNTTLEAELDSAVDFSKLEYVFVIDAQSEASEENSGTGRRQVESGTTNG